MGCSGRPLLFAGRSVPHQASSKGSRAGWEHWKPSLLQKMNHQITSSPSLQASSDPSAYTPIDQGITPTFALSIGKTQPHPSTAAVGLGLGLVFFLEDIYKDLIVERKTGISFPFPFQGSPNPSPLVQKHTGKGFLFCLIRFKGIFVWG